MTVETLEVAWSGAMEARTEAPGLSSYIGRSSLHHSASWAQAEARELEADGYAQSVAEPERPAWAGVKPVAPKLSVEREGAVALLLRKGVSYRRLFKDFGVSVSQARRIAKSIGLVRGASL